MDQENSDNFFQSIFANVAGNLEPAPHTLRQRRWRANRKIRPYPAELSSLIPPVEPINEEDLHSSLVDENYENNLYDEYLENNPYGDEYLEADTLEDDYDFSLNQIGIESNEKFIEEELDQPLYDGAPVSIKCYHKQIVDFGNLVQLTDSNMNKLLKLIRNALPFKNKLLKSYKKVVSLFQKKSSFNEVLRCTSCLEIINNNYCSIICERNYSQRLVGDVIEHFSTDRSNTQLIDVIRRNKQLILTYPQLVDKLLQCDVMTQLICKEKRKELQAASNDTYPITLMLHIDSTPIVHWSRKHTWFVTASIVEIPPPLRENHLNLLLLSIWNAPIKPDVDLLLMDICDTIKQVLFVDDMKFSIDVLLFKADLPARALATKHVHHNGYYACLECDQQGVWCDEGRFVAYPYIQSAINLRTSAHLDMCAKLLSQQSSGGNYCGVKGISPLTKILDIPTQIDLDSMHLCFIGHCSLLLSKWEKMIVKEAWLSGNEFLSKTKWPHNFNVELRTFSDRTYWKAHDYRAFFLYLMFPFVFSFLPEHISSHFSLYFVFLRTLYFYHDLQEVMEVESLIKTYCEHALSIYGPTFYLYSTHAHLHLVEKVVGHGALCFHNCFGNESFFRFIRTLRSGNRMIARQICRSFDKSRCTSKKEIWSINNIFLDEKLILDDYLDREYITKYQSEFLHLVGNIIGSTDNPHISYFCRASKGLSEFHSLSYRRRGNTQSFVVSFFDNKNNKCFGEILIIMYDSPLINDNNENIEQRLSQEFPAQSYHEMQPVSIVSIPQSRNDINRHSLSLRVCDTRFDNHRSATQPSSAIFNSATTSKVAPVTSAQLPAKKRRTAPGVLVAPSTAPLPRKRFNPAIQSTAASLMRNFVPGETTVSSNVVAENTRSISETTQNGFNQTMKPLIKLCEETNQLMKDMLKQTTEQTRLMNELINFPRELQKTTQQLSHIVHMQAKVSQARQNNNDDDQVVELNGINISHVSRGSSLNATARSLIRAAYGESASFNNLAPGEFDLLLGFIAHIHGLHAVAVFADSHSIKNSLQQMKHDINKKSSSSYSSVAASKQRTSTTIETPSIFHEDDDDDDDDDDHNDKF
ncbi:unnamed protein product [Rotaria socialis]|uniref:Transposase domain-containing protein n=5 Tax=Rotaria TaxID=231623 RepID=A0A818QWW5_9BILA|nr:unnamed protein product [Rotaria socialis]